jgi:hypothetical protein
VRGKGKKYVIGKVSVRQKRVGENRVVQWGKGKEWAKESRREQGCTRGKERSRQKRVGKSRVVQKGKGKEWAKESRREQCGSKRKRKGVGKR